MKKLLALILCLILCLSLFACNKTEEPTKTEDPAKGTENEDAISAEKLLGLNNVDEFSISVNYLFDYEGFRVIDPSAIFEKLLQLGPANIRVTHTESNEDYEYESDFFTETAASLGWKWGVHILRYTKEMDMKYRDPLIGWRPAAGESYVYCNGSMLLIVNPDNNTRITCDIIDAQYGLEQLVEAEYKKLPVKIIPSLKNGAFVLPDMTPQSIVFSTYGKRDISYSKDLDSIYGILKGFTDVKATDSQPGLDYFGGSVLIHMYVKFENHDLYVTLHDQEDVIMIDEVWYAIGDSEQLHKLIDIAKGRNQGYHG